MEERIGASPQLQSVAVRERERVGGEGGGGVAMDLPLASSSSSGMTLIWALLLSTMSRAPSTVAASSTIALVAFDARRRRPLPRIRIGETPPPPPPPPHPPFHLFFFRGTPSHSMGVVRRNDRDDDDDDDMDDVVVRIRKARYADLPDAAGLIADAFFGEEMRINPAMRLIRPLLELDRLQRAYPYDMDDESSGTGGGRHYYLVAHEMGRGRNDDEDDGGAAMKEDGLHRTVVGFCDVDGRVIGGGDDERTTGGAGPGPFSFLPTSPSLPWTSSTKLRRPLPYLSDLVIRSDRRRMGVASRLLDVAERLAGGGAKGDGGEEVEGGGMGYRDLYLCIRESNYAASDMYLRRGYEVVEPIDEDMATFVRAQDGLIVFRRSLS